MSRKIFASILFFLLAAALRSFTLEVGATFRLENLSFARDRPPTDTTYSGTDLYWGGAVYGSHPLSDSFSLEAGVTSDTILRYTTYALFTFQDQILTVSAGPFFGLLNTGATPVKPGISSSLRLMLPGILYAQVRADTSLGGNLSAAGDYLQEQTAISAGFYVPNAICSLCYLRKRFTEKTAAGAVVDSLTDWSFQTDIFQKNVPYRIQLTFSWQTLSRQFDGSAARHTLNSLVLGSRVDWSVGEYLTLLADLQSSVYTFGMDDLLGVSNPGPGGYMFRLFTGARLDFAHLPSSRI